MAKGHFTPFTEEQETAIKKDYLIKPVKRLAFEANCSYGRIIRFLKKNELVIPAALILKRKLDSQKKKGDIPFNKGKKQSEYMSPEAIEKSVHTRFKKGQEPHNVNKTGNGAVVIRKDKAGRNYKYIRLAKGYWDLHHRIVWEESHGKIPKNHIVVFKDENPENTTLENLELITMAENMYRNSVHDYPKEIIPSMVLNKKLETLLKKLENG